MAAQRAARRRGARWRAGDAGRAARFAGTALEVALHGPAAWRHRFTGILGGYEGGAVLVDAHGAGRIASRSLEIDGARLVPSW